MRVISSQTAHCSPTKSQKLFNLLSPGKGSHQRNQEEEKTEKKAYTPEELQALLSGYNEGGVASLPEQDQMAILQNILGQYEGISPEEILPVLSANLNPYEAYQAMQGNYQPMAQVDPFTRQARQQGVTYDQFVDLGYTPEELAAAGIEQQGWDQSVQSHTGGPGRTYTDAAGVSMLGGAGAGLGRAGLRNLIYGDPTKPSMWSRAKSFFGRGPVQAVPGSAPVSTAAARSPGILRGAGQRLLRAPGGLARFAARAAVGPAMLAASAGQQMTSDAMLGQVFGNQAAKDRLAQMYANRADRELVQSLSNYQNRIQGNSLWDRARRAGGSVYDAVNENLYQPGMSAVNAFTFGLPGMFGLTDEATPGDTYRRYLADGLSGGELNRQLRQEALNRFHARQGKDMADTMVGRLAAADRAGQLGDYSRQDGAELSSLQALRNRAQLARQGGGDETAIADYNQRMLSRIQGAIKSEAATDPELLASGEFNLFDPLDARITGVDPADAQGVMDLSLDDYRKVRAAPFMRALDSGRLGQHGYDRFMQNEDVARLDDPTFQKAFGSTRADLRSRLQPTTPAPSPAPMPAQNRTTPTSGYRMSQARTFTAPKRPAPSGVPKIQPLQKAPSLAKTKMPGINKIGFDVSGIQDKVVDSSQSIWDWLKNMFAPSGDPTPLGNNPGLRNWINRLGQDAKASDPGRPRVVASPMPASVLKSASTWAGNYVSLGNQNDLHARLALLQGLPLRQALAQIQLDSTLSPVDKAWLIEQLESSDSGQVSAPAPTVLPALLGAGLGYGGSSLLGSLLGFSDSTQTKSNIAGAALGALLNTPFR